MTDGHRDFALGTPSPLWCPAGEVGAARPPATPRGPAPSQSAMQFRLRLWRKRDWMERVCGESRRRQPPSCSGPRHLPGPVPDPHRCVPRHVTWGMVFIRLYLCTSSSFEGIRCCPFPIPVESDTAPSLPARRAPQGGCCGQRAGAPRGDMGTGEDTCHRHPRGRPCGMFPSCS